MGKLKLVGTGRINKKIIHLTNLGRLGWSKFIIGIIRKWIISR